MEDHDEEHGWGFADGLEPSFFEPATPLIQIPKTCPKEVGDDVVDASRLYWTSPPSAGNRLRAGLERLMDNLGIPKKAKNKKGKFDTLSLHARLERFAKKRPDVGSHLLAIKWLGNSGSHSSEFTANDALDAFELLALALEEIYDEKSAKLKKLTAAIIKKKGPMKK